MKHIKYKYVLKCFHQRSKSKLYSPEFCKSEQPYSMRVGKGCVCGTKRSDLLRTHLKKLIRNITLILEKYYKDNGVGIKVNQVQLYFKLI